MFATSISKPAASKARYYAPSGDGYNNIYGLCPDGVVRKIGERDLQHEIQLYRDVCNIDSIMDRYRDTGSLEFAQRQGVYLDVSGYPDTMADAVDLIDRVRSMYGLFPDEVKALFGSAEAYIAAINDGSVFQRLEKLNVSRETLVGGDKNEGA